MKENLNKYINSKNNELKNSSFSFESLFEIIHNQDDRVFIEYIDLFRVKQITYKDFKKYCYRFATYLSSKISDPIDSFVGIMMENSTTWIASFWALLMLGYKPLLINCKLPLSMNEQIVKSLNVNTIITNNENIIVDDVNVITIESSNALIESINNLEEYKPTKFANSIALSTTATSLNYKVCVYSGKDITYQALNAKSIISKNKWMKKTYKGSIKMLCFLPFYHIFGLVASYFWFAIFGRIFVFLQDYSSDTIVKTIQRHNVTHIFAVPLFWNTIVRKIKREVNTLPESDRKKFNKGLKLSLFLQNAFPSFGMKVARKLFTRITSQLFGNSISFLISGGGYISSESLKIINGIGYPLFNGYGSTEIGITSVELRRKPKYRMLGTVGKPFDSVEYKLENGTLLVKGSSTASTIIYKDKTKLEINENSYYNTMDNVRVDKKGYYYILGRNDDVVIGENGEKINPDYIEKNFLISSIDNYALVNLNGALTFIFEIPSNHNDLLIKKIYLEVKGLISKLNESGINIRKVYYSYDSLVNKNAIKVSRSQLLRNIENNKVKLEDFSNLYSYTNKTSEEISSSILESVRKVVSDVLNKNLTKEDDNKHFIFELGGSSLDYCTLLMKMKETFAMEFDASKNSLNTIEEFAKYIVKQSGGN